MSHSLWSHFQGTRAWGQLTCHHLLTAVVRANHGKGLCQEPPGRQPCDRAQHRPGSAGLGLALGVPRNSIHSPNSTSSGHGLLASSSSCWRGELAVLLGSRTRLIPLKPPLTPLLFSKSFNVNNDSTPRKHSATISRRTQIKCSSHGPLTRHIVIWLHCLPSHGGLRALPAIPGALEHRLP